MWLHSETWHPYQTLNISSFLRTCLGMNWLAGSIQTCIQDSCTHCLSSNHQIIICRQIGHACILPGEGSGWLHFGGTATGGLLSHGLGGIEHGYQLQVQFWRSRRQRKGLLCFSRLALHAAALWGSASARAGHARCSTLIFNGASSCSTPALSFVLLSVLV